MAGQKTMLLDFWASPFSMRVRIALAEKGVDYECIEENPLDKKSSLLLEMNPVHKKIPVFIHNGKPISESSIIVEYIDEVWKKEPFLIPQDSPYECATARFWVDFVDKKMYQTGIKILTTKGEVQELAKKELIEHFKLLEGALGDKPFFRGENFGFVDISLIPFAGWFPVFESYGNFMIEDECPTLIAWVKRCMERESVCKTFPDPEKIIDFACMMMKKLGIE